MADEITYGRETVQIVEIEQPRCVNRFGVSPCTAVGTPLCYQTYWTCLDRPNYDPSGVIRWRFCRPQDQAGWLYEQSGDDDISTNSIPLVQSVSTTSSSINLGSSREGESPLGTRAKVTITMQDAPWDDHVGDFYIDDARRSQKTGNTGFWALWVARNPFYPNITIRVYEGYRGQALNEMQVRLYDLETVNGPDARGRVTIIGRDPLDKARNKKAKFPRITDIDLRSAISASETSIPVACLEEELSDAFGNTGTTRYAAIDNEILRYTGYTGTEPNFTLTGVVRGVLNTTAESHDDDAAVQRVGRYENIRMYQIAEDLLKNHTEIPDTYVNTGGQWDDEGDSFLSTLSATATVAESVGVEDLIGELCRDGLFSIWWDERLQRIPLLAVRPPQETPENWTDRDNVIEGSYALERRPDDRMTRVTIFYNQTNALEPQEEARNYSDRRIRVDAEVELPASTGGEVRENTFFSRWIRTDSNALLVEASLLLRYRLPPAYLTVDIDAKDRSTMIGDVIDFEPQVTRHIVDTEGNPVITRWQVISIEETNPGTTARTTLQSYTFIGRFSVILANDAPSFADATDDEKENGCWLADDVTGLMPDGTEPYLLQ